MDKKLILRTNLMKLRGNEQLTQAQFAKRINKSRSWVSLVESGIRNPNKESMSVVATVFGIENHNDLTNQEFKPLISLTNKSAICQSIKETACGVKKGRLVISIYKDRVKEIRLDSITEKFDDEGERRGDIATAISESLHILTAKIGLKDRQLVFNFTLSNQGEILSLNALPETA